MNEAIGTQEIPDGFRQIKLGPKKIIVPNHWSHVSVKEISEIVTRGKQPTYVDAPGVPIINQSCIYWDGFHPENLKYLDEDVAKDWKKKYFASKGDVLLNSLGKGTIGRALYWDGESDAHGIDPCITRISVDSDIIEPEFLRYYLESSWGQTMLHVFCVAGSTGQIGLSKTDLLSMPVLCPPLSEQRRIAEILSTVDILISQTKDIVDWIKRLRTGTFQDLLSGGVSGKETSCVKVPMIPKEWELPTQWNLEFLEDVTELITDGTHQTPNYTSSGVPFLRVENIKNNQVDWDNVNSVSQSEYEKIVSGKVPSQGDVLLSKNGTIGRTQVVDWEQRFAYYVSLCLIRPRPEVVNSKYLAEVLSSEICLQQTKIRVKKATVSNLHLEEIRKLSIPIPPLETQERIVYIINKINELLSFEIEYLESIEDLKRGLMQDLLTGKVRVPTET